MAGAAGAGVGRHEERRSLGGAKASQHRDAEARLLHGKFIEAGPDVRRERRAREEHRLQFSEKPGAQRSVIPQVRQQGLDILWDVEINRGRDFAKIAHGLLDAAGHRLASVEIHRPAIIKRQPDIVIAAKGVIPRQPVDDHRLLLQEGHGFADHDLVGADHPLGVDDRLRIAGGAGGQQEFGDCVGTDGLMRGIDARMQRRCHQFGEQRHIAAARRTVSHGDFGFRGDRGLKRAAEFIGVVGEDEPRRQELHEIGKFAVVFRYQRIGWRHRAEGNTCI